MRMRVIWLCPLNEYFLRINFLITVNYTYGWFVSIGSFHILPYNTNESDSYTFLPFHSHLLYTLCNSTSNYIRQSPRTCCYTGVLSSRENPFRDCDDKSLESLHSRPSQQLWVPCAVCFLDGMQVFLFESYDRCGCCFAQIPPLTRCRISLWARLRCVWNSVSVSSRSVQCKPPIRRDIYTPVPCSVSPTFCQLRCCANSPLCENLGPFHQRRQIS